MSPTGEVGGGADQRPAPSGEVRLRRFRRSVLSRLPQPSSLQVIPLPVADNKLAVFYHVHHGIDPEVINQIGIIGGVAEHHVHLTLCWY